MTALRFSKSFLRTGNFDFSPRCRANNAKLCRLNCTFQIPSAFISRDYAKNDVNQQKLHSQTLCVLLLTNPFSHKTNLRLEDPREGICGVPSDPARNWVRVKIYESRFVNPDS
jgi:hypothetical protein